MMVVRIVAGSVLAAIVLFMWGYVFWAVSPIGTQFIHPLEQNGLAVTSLVGEATETGVYFSPSMNEAEARRDGVEQATLSLEEAKRQGPVLQIMLQRDGVVPMSTTLLHGFLHYLASTLLAALVLAWAAPALPTYLARVGLVFLVGIFAAVSVQLSSPIWFHHPWDYSLMQAGFFASNGLLSGIVLGAAVKADAGRMTAEG